MPDAFQNLVRQHRHRIYTYAYYFLRHQEDAEDATQEVLVKLWRHRRRIDAGKVAPWLIRVTRNACIDAQRKRRGERRVVLTRGDDEDLEAIPSGARNPEEMASSSEFLQRLEGAVRCLPEPFRSLLILREIQELKYDEIAGALGMPINTVKVYLHRGRRMLREHLRDWRREQVPAHTGRENAYEGGTSHAAG
jgi:RNA polymerase sigma-70 factor (ECF subfamily)